LRSSKESASRCFVAIVDNPHTRVMNPSRPFRLGYTYGVAVSENELKRSRESRLETGKRNERQEKKNSSRFKYEPK
jgi:hypothetical protein